MSRTVKVSVVLDLDVIQTREYEIEVTEEQIADYLGDGGSGDFEYDAKTLVQDNIVQLYNDGELTKVNDIDLQDKGVREVVEVAAL